MKKKIFFVSLLVLLTAGWQTTVNNFPASLSTTNTFTQLQTFNLGVLIGASDTGVTRDSAGVFDFGNGVAQDKSGTLKATTGTFTGVVSGASGSFTGNMAEASLLPTSPIITAGADATVNNVGEVRRVVYKATGQTVLLNPSYSKTVKMPIRLNVEDLE